MFGSGFRRSTSLTRLPTLRLVALISFFGQLYFFVPVLTPYLLQRNLSIAEIAGLQSTLLITLLVMEIPTGVIADRLGHVWSYRLSLFVLTAGECMFLFAREYPMFLLVQVVTGIGYAFASGSVDAIIYDTLPPGDRTSAMQRAKGVLGAATQTGSVVAYSIGGLITADLTLPRMTITIVMGALALATASALSLQLRQAAHPVERPRQNSRAILGIAWRAIRTNHDLRWIILCSIVTCGFGAHLLVFYQQYFLETGVPGVWFGFALSIASIVVVGAQFSAWRLPILLGTRWSLILATALPGVLYLAMAWTTTPWLAVALFVAQWVRSTSVDRYSPGSSTVTCRMTPGPQGFR